MGIPGQHVTKLAELARWYRIHLRYIEMMPIGPGRAFSCPGEDELLAELLLTTGGTGFSERDRTPEATLAVAERIVPGIPEAMRAYSMQFTKRAMLSRSAAGIRKQTLIINLPGSPKAVRERLYRMDHSVRI